MNKDSIYCEVIIEHYDDIEKVWCIDAYKTDDSAEEGVVVARINLLGEVIWEIEEAKDDIRVKEEIENFKSDYIFSTFDFDTISKKLRNIFFNNDTYCNEGIELEVYNKDGITTYCVEKVSILENVRYAIGMRGMEEFKLFMPTDYDIDNAIEYLINDIACAVGAAFAFNIQKYNF